MKQNVYKPTDKELAKGPVVTLSRPGWVGHSWQPHGFYYTLRFDDNAETTMLASHFDEWIGDVNAAVNGITVTRPTKAAKRNTPKPTK